MSITYTTRRNYPKPDFNSATWHTQMHQSLDMIDQDVAASTVFDPFIVAPLWTYNTNYVVNDVVVDDSDATLWKCLVNHTSPGTSTFNADRVAHPTYWQNVGTILRIRGTWAQNTLYTVLDHVYDIGEGVSAICLVQHTSTLSGTIRTDAANWAFIVDLSLIISPAQRGQAILEGQVFG